MLYHSYFVYKMSQSIEKGMVKVDHEENLDAQADQTVDTSDKKKQVKFEIFGEELIEKRVKASGNSGRVYLPPNWIGHHVKIVRID